MLKITGQSFNKKKRGKKSDIYSEIGKTACSPFSFLLCSFSSLISCLSFTLLLSRESPALSYSLWLCFSVYCLALLWPLASWSFALVSRLFLSRFLASLWLLSIRLKIKCALWHDVGAAAWPGAKITGLIHFSSPCLHLYHIKVK